MVSRSVILILVIKMYYYRSRHEGLYIRHDRDDPHEFKKFSMHTHTTAEVFYFVSGKAVYHVEGSAYTLQPGDILLMRPAEAHYVEQDRNLPYERICLNFDTEILSALDPEKTILRPFYDREPGQRNLYRTGTSDVYRSYLDNILDSPDDRFKAIANLILLLGELGNWFAKEHTSADQHDTLEYRIVQFINQNLQKELSIETICEQFFISRAQLCRRFKKVTGTSVGKYVTVKRLIKAQSMILQGTKPTEVYGLCGYQDYSTFYRAYLQYFGHSPSNATQSALTEDRLEIV